MTFYKIHSNLLLTFRLCLLIALILSLYMLIMNIKTNSNIHSCWQFPMLLAIFLETIYITTI